MHISMQHCRYPRCGRIIYVLSKPADRRIVIMCPSIDDTILRSRRTDTFHLIEVQHEMQYLHAWETAFILQLFNFVSYYAQVLSDYRQFTNCRLNLIKEFLTWAFYPSTVDCRLGLTIYLPIGFKSAEMVNTYDIYKLIQLSKTLFPPHVPVFLHYIPVVLRIAPKLPGSTEIIWRNPRNGLCCTIGIQHERFLMCPYVRAVLCDKYRHVPHELHIILIRILMQLFPLSEEYELLEFDEADILTILLPSAFQYLLVAIPHFFWPLHPALALIIGFQ